MRAGSQDGSQDRDEERDLVEACRRGDLSALHQVFERHKDRVFHLAYRFTGSLDDAEDLTQETFLRVFDQIGRFRSESSLGTWIYRIAVSVCLNHRRRRPCSSLDALEWEPLDPDADPARVYERGEVGRQVRAAVEALPETLHSAFALVSLEGLSYSEAAAILGLTVEAVRMRMSRARRELRERLKEGAL